VSILLPRSQSNEELNVSQSPGVLTGLPMMPRVHPWVRGLARLGYSVVRPWLRRRLGRTVLEHVEGLPLLVLPQVFNPRIYRTGRLLVQALATLPGSASAAARAEEARALDMGTGSGLGAVCAARLGYRVTAVDINPDAVRCARINALQHQLEERIAVRQGDLFEPVQGERFDLVLFNPPFFRGQPQNRLDAAWRSMDMPERFAAGLPAALQPEGLGLLVLSTDGDQEGWLLALTKAALQIDIVARRHFGNEIVSVYCVRPGQTASR
jgi:release factor glutamine methyltransferase